MMAIALQIQMLFFISFILISSSAIAGPTAKLLTPSGAVINQLMLEIGDVFEDTKFEKSYDLDYRVDAKYTDSNLVLEPPLCQISGNSLKDVDLRFDGKTMVSIREVKVSRFRIDVKINVPSEVEGELICDSGELRVLESGAVLASVSFRGFVHRVPRWGGLLGERLRDVWFSFDGMVANARPGSDIISKSLYIRLSHAKAYPAMARFVSPTSCRIGATIVPEGNVRLRINSSEIEDGGVVSIMNDSVQQIGLTIGASAGMGDKSGIVRCSNKGALIYSY